MKKVRLLVSVVLFGFLLLSSCDKKDAILVNRRTATAERIKEIKEEQKERERQQKEEREREREKERERERQRAREEEALRELVDGADINLFAADRSRLIDILTSLTDVYRSRLMSILTSLNSLNAQNDRSRLISILADLPVHRPFNLYSLCDRYALINILTTNLNNGGARSRFINLYRDSPFSSLSPHNLADVCRQQPMSISTMFRPPISPAPQELVNAANLDLSATDCSHLINILNCLDAFYPPPSDIRVGILTAAGVSYIGDRSRLISILKNLKAYLDDPSDLISILNSLDASYTGVRCHNLISILDNLKADIGARTRLISILKNLKADTDNRSRLIDILENLHCLDDRLHLINVLKSLKAQGGNHLRLIRILNLLDAPDDRRDLISILTPLDDSGRSRIISILTGLDEQKDRRNLINLLTPPLDNSDRSRIISILTGLGKQEDRRDLIDLLRRLKAQGGNHLRLIRILNLLDAPYDRPLLINILSALTGLDDECCSRLIDILTPLDNVSRSNLIDILFFTPPNNSSRSNLINLLTPLDKVYRSNLINLLIGTPVDKRSRFIDDLACAAGG